MKLEQLVTTYVQSKRLKELGIRSLRSRPILSRYTRLKQDKIREGKIVQELYVSKTTEVQSVSARTAEELGEILPESIIVDKEGRAYQYRMRITKGSERYEIEYYDSIHAELLIKYIPDRSEGEEVGFILGPTLAQAMGDMLIYLLENNLLPSNKKDDN